MKIREFKLENSKQFFPVAKRKNSSLYLVVEKYREETFGLSPEVI